MDSAVFLIFLSKGYFLSKNCRRELYAALALKKPIVTIREDESRGGASAEVLKQACRKSCIEPEPYPGCTGPEEVIRLVVEIEPVVWVRLNDYQAESLKTVAFRMLHHLPYYEKNKMELQRGQKLPGELGTVCTSLPVTLLWCKANNGSSQLAEEIRIAYAAGSLANSSRIEMKEVADAAMEDQTQTKVMLVYLNRETFSDDGVRLA